MVSLVNALARSLKDVDMVPILLLQLLNCIAGLSDCVRPCTKGAPNPQQFVIPQITNGY